ncbi:MAG TPA: NfeD family protein [Acidimicrobiales bacterium]
MRESSLSRMWTRSRGRKQESAMLNGVSGMIGETAVVTKKVTDRHQPGAVLTRGEEWYAVSLFPGTTIAKGTTVVVADVDRGLLVVYPTGES